MKDLTGLITDLRTLAVQATEAAEALERLKAVQNLNIKWSLTVEELAIALGVTEETVYEYARQGVIPSRRLGRRYIFSRSAIMQWLEDDNRELRKRA
ncbi:MAG: helix-turn-helix domain-containing protein [Dethiobacter sp.]|nr:helix-turn-helix domain-containing protein [Dethiobacter sp.]MBS3898680.1 helix-turn-helix domain-containing protein [Dethiobacter sp.]